MHRSSLHSHSFVNAVTANQVQKTLLQIITSTCLGITAGVFVKVIAVQNTDFRIFFCHSAYFRQQLTELPNKLKCSFLGQTSAKFGFC